MLTLIIEANDEHGILKKKLTKIEKGKESEQVSILAKMAIFMKENNGVGLTASQVGIDKKMFVMTINAGQENEYYEYVINPVILTKSKNKVTFPEGCLSYPEKGEILVKRSAEIFVQYHNGEKTVRTKYRDYEGIVWQHEYDHCQGDCPLGR